MSYKQMPRLGSAIASTILSLFSAVSLVGVDKAQAAVLHYNFTVYNGEGDGFFKVSNSSLTGIGLEQVAVSEGRYYGLTLGSHLSRVNAASADKQPKEYYNLAGATALFDQGDFSGLQASGEDRVRGNIYAGPRYDATALWYIGTLNYLDPDPMWRSTFVGYYQIGIIRPDGSMDGRMRRIYGNGEVSYTLVNTEAEPVPEPLTAGGTALALAGLSWLKQKKKMAA